MAFGIIGTTGTGTLQASCLSPRLLLLSKAHCGVIGDGYEKSLQLFVLQGLCMLYCVLAVCRVLKHTGLSCLGHYFLFIARSKATAIATVAPTIGLLPMPRKPIISTWAGTDEEPAN